MFASDKDFLLGVVHPFSLCFSHGPVLAQTPGTLKWQCPPGSRILSSPAIGVMEPYKGTEHIRAHAELGMMM
jgi:hypothetical protein